MNDGTAFEKMPGWYIRFQAALLQQAPRNIEKTAAIAWANKQDDLKKVLQKTLCAPKQSTGFEVWETVICGVGPKTPAQFISALKKNGDEIDEDDPIDVDPLLAMIHSDEFKKSIASEKTSVDIGAIRPSELGYE